MKTISLRYCGGCNPAYDRTQLTARLKRALDHRCRFVEGDDPATDWPVIIHGCPTACAQADSRKPDHVINIRNPQEADAFIAGVLTGDPDRFAHLIWPGSHPACGSTGGSESIA